MNKYLFLAVQICVLFGVYGCSGSPVRGNSLPEWAKIPPGDTAAYWYSVGSGYDSGMAEKAALAAIATRLRVAVQSESEIYGGRRTDGDKVIAEEWSKTVDQLFTGKINFPGYELKRSEESGGQFHVLLAVDKSRFVQQYSRDIEATGRTLQEAQERLREKPAIEQYVGKGEVQDSAYELLALIDLLAAADPGFAQSAQRYRQQVSGALSYLADIKNRLAFHIVADGHSQTLQDAVRDLLTEENVPVTGRQGRDSAVVKLATSILHQGRDAIGGYELSVKTQITLQTAQGRVVGSRRLTLFGASTNNYDYAAQALADDLKEKVDKEGGIFDFLNASAEGEN